MSNLPQYHAARPQCDPYWQSRQRTVRYRIGIPSQIQLSIAAFCELSLKGLHDNTDWEKKRSVLFRWLGSPVRAARHCEWSASNTLHYHGTPLVLLSRRAFFFFLSSPTTAAYIFTEQRQSAGFASFNVQKAPVSVIIPGGLVPLSASPGSPLSANTPRHSNPLFRLVGNACIHVSVLLWTRSRCQPAGLWPGRAFSHSVNQHLQWETLAPLRHGVTTASQFWPACCLSRAPRRFNMQLRQHS